MWSCLPELGMLGDGWVGVGCCLIGDVKVRCLGWLGVGRGWGEIGCLKGIWVNVNHVTFL